MMTSTYKIILPKHTFLPCQTQERVRELDLPYIGYIHEGLIVASVDRKYWGYVNPQGQWVIPPKYTKASYFSDGMAYVKVDDEGFFINKKGEVSFNLPGLEGIISAFKKGVACVRINGQRAYINTQGQIIFQP